MHNRNIIVLTACLLWAGIAITQNTVQISPASLKDKIKGGWAGQTIGVTYGAPVEFHFQGTMINDYQPLKWYDGLLKRSMTEGPGIYDDLYMDITFVEVFEREGLDAPVASHAKAFSDAGYMLWHANQAARYNIQQGIAAPQSGHWLNNPHADCIDYQIEADFSGLMSPAMPNTASNIGDKIGHIMNYGDGWYGGVYIGALYALAFTSNDIEFIVKEALKTIPIKSDFHQCIADVIRWHAQYPNDWKQTWFEIQKKWTDDIGCPDGVFSPFNIDAKVNAAYVVLGLLYGNGDFGKSLEIATRAGQDADCNPSSVGGILGTIMGYEKIPAYWKMGLHEIEDMNFKYTSTSLNKVYELSYRHALENIRRQGGNIKEDMITIPQQAPIAVREEVSFPRLRPTEKRSIGRTLTTEWETTFQGSGFVLKGECKTSAVSANEVSKPPIAVTEIYIDDQLIESVRLPMHFQGRRHEIAWNYQLQEKEHKIRLKRTDSETGGTCYLHEMIIYTGK
jgi:hypothetical protein